MTKTAVKSVSILGSTGSIGASTLAVIDHLQPAFRVAGLSAGKNVARLAEQVERYRPRIVSVETEAQAAEFQRRYQGPKLRVVAGPEGAEEVAGLAESDIVVSAITGINGLRPTLAAIRAGKRIALANKESMVVAGALLRREARAARVEIVPVDSEHSGVFQCLAREKRRNVAKVVLTASGGPFLKTPLREIPGKSVAQALAHPRWTMGRKVTIDSATMMNKGLELIEARWLFDLAPEALGVLVHPQSIVHALVEMRDGSVIAQLSPTDMKIPIQYALTWPERLEPPLPPLDLAAVGRLEFGRADERRFPLLRTARWALREGESAPVALNAANEVAVEAFLGGRIGFGGIRAVVDETAAGHVQTRIRSLEDIFEADRASRATAHTILKRRC
jgi:1-deoxy-D-xylulose-5-phosphate reductoisomerase